MNFFPVTFRGRSLGLGLLGALVGFVLSAPVCLAGAVRNVVIITTDDQGLQAGCYGDPLAVTPNLDALAAGGVLFERGYSTQASCSPARASLLTGLYPHQNGQIGLAGHHPEYRVKDGLPNLPVLLKGAGYATGILGKLHVSPGEAFPFDFAWASHGDPTLTRDVRTVAAKAAEFLDGPAAGKPFFLYVNYFDPHRPFDAGAHQTAGLPEQPYTEADVKPLAYLGMDGKPARTEAAAYYNSIRRMDTGLGMLFDVLKERDLWEDTLVVFVGDHGPPFTRAKTTVYEAGEHVPFLVRWPGVATAGLRSEALVSFVDIMPTVLDAAGVTPPPMAGESLRPVVAGAVPENWREHLFTEYTAHEPKHFFPRRAVRTSDHKLIHNLLPGMRNPVPYQGATKPGPGNRVEPSFLAAYKTMEMPPEFEFYVLDDDPHEIGNKVDDPAHAETIAKLKESLLAWRRDTSDPLLDPDEFARLLKAHDQAD